VVPLRELPSAGTCPRRLRRLPPDPVPAPRWAVRFAPA